MAVGRHRRVASRDGRRLPALDGIRGLAVLAVLLFHAGVPWARGGFLGVDAFFVLSGYLITVVVLREWRATGVVSLRRFWARRARRLLPALLLVLAALAAYATSLPLEARPRLRGDAFATLGYVANWRFVLQSEDYFAHTGPPSPLRHTWSLAVEEQFYLLWPLVLLVAVRLRRPRLAVGLVAAVGAAASTLAMAVLAAVPGTSTARLYYGTDTRIGSLLVGCAVAALLARPPGEGPRPKRPWGLLTGIAAVAGASITGLLWVTADAARLWRGGFLLAAAATAVVVANVAVDPTGPLARLLAARPLAGLGVVSYGVYLWHWPVYAVVNGERTGLVGARLLAVRLAATLLFAVTSYLLVERPVLRGGLRSWRAVVVPPVSVGAVTAAVVVATAPAALTLPRQQPAPRVAPVAAAGMSPATLPPTAATTDAAPTTEAAPATEAAPRTAASAPPAADRSRRRVGTHTRVLLVGDSVALTLGYGLQRESWAYDVDVIDRGVLGCGLLTTGTYRYLGEINTTPAACAGTPQRWRADVAAYDPDVVLLLVGRWEVMDRVEDGRWVHVGDPACDGRLAGQLEGVVRLLSARGAAVGVLTAPYYRRAERPDGGLWPEDLPERVDRWNELVRAAVARHLGVAHLVDLGARTAPEPGVYRNRVDGVLLRYDGVHFTLRGARHLAHWILPQLSPWPRSVVAHPVAGSPPDGQRPLDRPPPPPVATRGPHRL